MESQKYLQRDDWLNFRIFGLWTVIYFYLLPNKLIPSQKVTLK